MINDDLINEDQQLLNRAARRELQNRTVLESLHHEYQLLYTGLTNKEYLDYCFVKGACQQTIPLALLVPVGLVLGVFNIVVRTMLNLMEGQGILSNCVYTILQIAALSICLYLLLKACEVIPKKINNPLLFGKVTTYIFMCLIVLEGVLVVERIAENVSRSFHTSQFWVVFALVVWQKILVLFIYDFKIRATVFVFLYIYYAFRISGDGYLWMFNCCKAIVYIALELILVVDNELKNYAQYQLENQTQLGTGDQFMVPPVSLFLQTQILETFSQNLPIIVFDGMKELIHISCEASKQLQLFMDGTNMADAQLRLRRCEVMKIYNRIEQPKDQMARLQKTARFGSTCGVNDKGELLHSLINGPALQQLRQSGNPVVQPQPVNYASDGLLEECLNILCRQEQDNVQGLLKYKIQSGKQETIKYYQFTLRRVDKNDNEFNIILIMDDVTGVMNNKPDKQQEQVDNLQDTQQLCQLVRQMVVTEDKQLLDSAIKIESKMCLQSGQTMRISKQLIMLDELTDIMNNRYNSMDAKLMIKNNTHMRQPFHSNQDRIIEIMDTIIDNTCNGGDISINIEDADNGITFGIVIENPKNITDMGWLQTSNQIIKILGQPQTINQELIIANKGIKIWHLKDYGIKLQFTVRNLNNDQQSQYILIDEDINNEDILQQYLVDADIKYLDRSNRSIKYTIIDSTIAIVKQQQNLSKPKKQPKLAGMLKLQEQGKLLGLNKVIDSQCTCTGRWLINSNPKFSNMVSHLNFTNQCTESEAYKDLMNRLVHNRCQGDCILYQHVIIHCSVFNYSYNQQYIIIIIRLLNQLIYHRLNIWVLCYQPYGEMISGIRYIDMPNNEWMQQLQLNQSNEQ